MNRDVVVVVVDAKISKLKLYILCEIVSGVIYDKYSMKLTVIGMRRLFVMLCVCCVCGMRGFANI